MPEKIDVGKKMLPIDDAGTDAGNKRSFKKMLKEKGCWDEGK